MSTVIDISAEIQKRTQDRLLRTANNMIRDQRNSAVKQAIGELALEGWLKAGSGSQEEQ